jgi:Fe-S-cluster containining protein
MSLKNILKRIFYYFWKIEISLQRFWLKNIKREKYYLLKWKCNQCGKCCEEPAIKVGKMIFFLPILTKIFLKWQLWANGFKLKKIDYINQTFIFECLNYDKKNNKCLDYENRPGICRDYPRILLYQVYPRFFPECGYCPLDPEGDKMLKKMREEGLTEEQIEKVKKELYLE